jgi:hypothetical protein
MEQLTVSDYFVLTIVLVCILILLVERLVSKYGECEHKDKIINHLEEIRNMIMGTTLLQTNIEKLETL